MKYFVYFFLFAVNYASLSAQSDNYKGISIWSNTSIEDTTRINALLLVLDNEFIYNHPDTTLLLATQASDLSKDIKYYEGMAQSIYCMAVAYRYLDQLDLAIDLQLQGISINTDLGNLKSMSKNYNSLGNTYLKKSEYDKALKSYLKAKDISLNIEDKSGLGKVCNNIGLLYYDLKEYNKSIENLNIGLEISREDGDEISEANSLTNLGSVYRAQKKYKIALEYYTRGLSVLEGRQTNYGLATCYSNIGAVYLAQGKQKKALVQFRKSNKIHSKLKDKKGIANSWIHIARTHLESNSDSSILYAQKAINLTQNTDYIAETKDAFEILYFALEKTSRYKESLEAHKYYQNLEDSILNTEDIKSILSVENQYKHKNSSPLAVEAQYISTIRSNYSFLWLSLITLGLIGLVLFLARRRVNQLKSEKNKLYTTINSLKEKLSTKTISTISDADSNTLNKSKIEQAIQSKIGDSSWAILQLLLANPSLSNKEIAKEIFLSLEGVSSSLRRMYVKFNIRSKSNKKIALLRKAVRISMED